MTERQPWYKTTLRWAQTNLTEIDPSRYDDPWWRNHWRRTRVQGAIINAGGIVAYYPSKFPLHHRAVALGDGDLYGQVVRSARDEGLKIIARMDSNRVADDFYRAHPDWICVDVEGRPYRQADKYVTCINSPYYSEYLPRVMEEIIERSKPDGFSDNSWPGMPRERICHCRNCRERFFDYARLDLPRAHDWSQENYRQWIRWNFTRRTELWDFNNEITTKAGGKDCIWSGMISGDVLNNNNRFIDLKEILPRAKIVMLDHQRRNAIDGFADNTEAGKRLHEVGGWDKLIPESTPQYQLGAPAFRLASMPPAEVRLWSSSGFAGGIQPWWHHIGAMHEDRRQYQTAEPIFRWHEANEQVLVDRKPVADVGIVWSQRNHDFHGQGKAAERTMGPYRGVMKALDRHALTYLPIHADDIAGATGRVKALILPNLGAMSDAQARAVEAFAAAGGAVIATGDTGTAGEFGEPRADYALAGLFGVHRGEGSRGGTEPIDTNIEVSSRHTYLRLSPELRAGVDGPTDRTAAATSETRHPVLAGLEQCDTIPFGGYLPVVTTDAGTQVLATYIPDFPIYPPETSWMRQPRSTLPAVAARTADSGAKLVWIAADLDRCFARDDNAEHALIIANAVRWALGGNAAVTVEGGLGVISPSLFEQGARTVLHLNNRLLTSRVPGRQDRLVPIGPLTVTVPGEKRGGARLLVAGTTAPSRIEAGRTVFTIDSVLDHEVVVLE
ncbi:beta-galactosidase [Alsobacter sp. SYSU M60028]|uniref:Beta-galactosidase n=1 Tax=Alsobacter ponti TaxID=2962936 RepID=A0ABT1LEA1_9HYPH|nr:beta-galactosidase [Alsobacter ponti]MCP8939446.1 beta-galactosidase [Alsobacter ponti]